MASLVTPLALLQRLLQPGNSRRGLLGIDVGSRKCGVALVTDLLLATGGNNFHDVSEGVPAGTRHGELAGMRYGTIPPASMRNARSLRSGGDIDAGSYAGGDGAIKAVGLLRASMHVRQGAGHSRVFYPTETHLELVRQLLAAHPRVGGIVLGWPVDPHGGRTPECVMVETFAMRLGAAGVAVPISLWDERGTSAAARAVLRQQLAERHFWRTGAGARDDGARMRKRVQRLPIEHASKVDEMAAVILLQGFCEWAVGHVHPTKAPAAHS